MRAAPTGSTASPESPSPKYVMTALRHKILIIFYISGRFLLCPVAGDVLLRSLQLSLGKGLSGECVIEFIFYALLIRISTVKIQMKSMMKGMFTYPIKHIYY